MADLELTGHVVKAELIAWRERPIAKPHLVVELIVAERPDVLEAPTHRLIVTEAVAARFPIGRRVRVTLHEEP